MEWTIDVNAAMGMTYRATSIAFFSASRATFFIRASDEAAVTCRMSPMMAVVSLIRICDSLA